MKPPKCKHCNGNTTISVVYVDAVYAFRCDRVNCSKLTQIQ